MKYQYGIDDHGFFTDWNWNHSHNLSDLREILALRLEVEGLQGHIATLTNQVTVLKDKCGEPESYKCVVYDMTPGETFAKVRQKLIEIGWTPPQGE